MSSLDDMRTRLLLAAREDRLPHALLLSGPKGSGRREAAELFVKTVLCEAEPVHRPCGVCPGCKKVREGMHPDLHTVKPNGTSIKVEQIRSLIEELGLTAHEGGRKAAVIEQADLMNEHAQNALLKTLEEPTGDTLFVLISASPEGLLTTIRSRCLQVRFRNRSRYECEHLLAQRGVEPARAGKLAGWAQGSVGRAMELTEDAEYEALRSDVIDMLEKLSRAADCAATTQRIGKRERRMDVLEIMELWGRDLFCVQNGIEPFQTEDLALLKASRLRGAKVLSQVRIMREMLENNVSWTNVLEKMYYELLPLRR